MLFLKDTWCREQRHPAGAKHRGGIAHAEGLKLRDLLVKRPVNLRQTERRIHPQHRLEVRCRKNVARVLLKALREFRNMFNQHGEARRLRMPAKALEEIAH